MLGLRHQAVPVVLPPGAPSHGMQLPCRRSSDNKNNSASNRTSCAFLRPLTTLNLSFSSQSWQAHLERRAIEEINMAAFVLYPHRAALEEPSRRGPSTAVRRATPATLIAEWISKMIY